MAKGCKNEKKKRSTLSKSEKARAECQKEGRVPVRRHKRTSTKGKVFKVRQTCRNKPNHYKLRGSQEV